MSTEEAQINEDETDFENLEEHVQASKIITKYLELAVVSPWIPVCFQNQFHIQFKTSLK